MTSTMRAVRIHAYGGPEELQIEIAPRPSPGPGEVLVRIHATSVNPVDWKMRCGATKERYPVRFPGILGRDLAGVVEAVAPGVSSFTPGDEVYGYCSVDRDGAYADYVALPAEHLAVKPTTLSLLEAAAMPTAALTAHIALFEHAGLAKGQRVLIHAGAGGVGSVAVQLAKAAGASVFATGSESSAALIKSLGADLVIDYRAQRFEEVARDLDVVLDAIGGETQTRSFRCLKPGGYLVTITSPRPAPETLALRNVRGSWAGARPDGELLSKIRAVIDAGQLRPVIDTVLPLTEVRHAHRLSEGGHAHGKIVLRTI